MHAREFPTGVEELPDDDAAGEDGDDDDSEIIEEVKFLPAKKNKKRTRQPSPETDRDQPATPGSSSCQKRQAVAETIVPTSTRRLTPGRPAQRLQRLRDAARAIRGALHDMDIAVAAIEKGSSPYGAALRVVQGLADEYEDGDEKRAAFAYAQELSAEVSATLSND